MSSAIYTPFSQQNSRPVVYIDKNVFFGKTQLAVFSNPSNGLIPYSGYFGKDGLGGFFVKNCRLSNGSVLPAWTFPIELEPQLNEIVNGIQTHLPPKYTNKSYKPPIQNAQQLTSGLQTYPSLSPQGTQNYPILAPIIGETLSTIVDGQNYPGQVTNCAKDSNGLITNFTYLIGGQTLNVKLIPPRWEIENYPVVHSIERKDIQIDLTQNPENGSITPPAVSSPQYINLLSRVDKTKELIKYSDDLDEEPVSVIDQE